MPRALASDSRRRFLRQAAAGAGSGLLFGLIPWQDVLARSAAAGIVPGTRVDARGQRAEAGTGSEAYIGEIILTPYSFEPRGYAFCNGQLLSITQNTALFSLLGTTFGGNGQSTFALPDLRGRLPRGQGGGAGLTWVELGESGGAAQVTLLETQLPPHRHAVSVGSGRKTRTPTASSYLAPTLDVPAYGTLSGQFMTTSAQGGGQPHPNLPPYAVLHFCICLQGLYPSRP